MKENDLTKLKKFNMKIWVSYLFEKMNGQFFQKKHSFPVSYLHFNYMRIYIRTILSKILVDYYVYIMSEGLVPSGVEPER